MMNDNLMNPVINSLFNFLFCRPNDDNTTSLQEDQLYAHMKYIR